MAIKSVQTKSGKRVQLGSKAYQRVTTAGDLPVSGTGKNLTAKDIRGVGGGFTDEPSTTVAKQAAEAEGRLLPYQQETGATPIQQAGVTQPSAPIIPITPQLPQNLAQQVQATPTATNAQLQNTVSGLTRYKQGLEAASFILSRK